MNERVQNRAEARYNRRQRAAGPTAGDRGDTMIQIAHDVNLALADVLAVASGAPATLAPGTAALLDERRRQVVTRIAATAEPAYGFNRGFGHNVDVRVPEDRLAALQLDLIRSHACGVGEAAPVEVVRAAMVLRAASLARGHSGVRSVVVQQLLGFLNHGITPVVPLYGSVGASGDLAPLAHVALALVGEGRVLVDGRAEPVPAAEALAAAGLAPLSLEPKEGLALINGSQFAAAFGVLACGHLETLLKTACLATAITAQVWLGTDTAYAADLHALRPHPGARTVARWLWDLMQGSPMRQAHAEHEVDWEVQDPYSLRCAAQILGTCHDLIACAGRTFEIEAASVTDNPLLLLDDDGTYTRIVSGGHFHGMPVAVALHQLMQALAIMASLSQVRSARYVDEDRNKGLGADLIWPGLSASERATASGMMIPEYISAALVNTIWSACAPSHLWSLPTDAGQEDHVSMSAPLAVRLWQTLPRLAEVLAIELAYGSQAAAIRARSTHMPSKRELTAEQTQQTAATRDAYVAALEHALSDVPVAVDVDVWQLYPWPEAARRLSPACERALAVVRDVFHVVTQDRPVAADIAALAERVVSGAVVAEAEAVVALKE
jgi:histidine ammonia-lyase